MSTVIRGTDNSVSAPAVTGTDSDTGLYFPAANQLALATNGTQAIFIDSSQKVGVGTSAPDVLFQVQGSGQNLIYVRDTSAYSAGVNGGGILFQGLDSGSANRSLSVVQGISDGSNAGGLVFQTRSSGSLTERMRITSAGNVGIGTTSPRSGLEIANSAGGELTLRYIGNTGFGGIKTDASNQLLFSTASTTFTERARIDSSGNLLVNSTGVLAGAATSKLQSRATATDEYAVAGAGENASYATVVFLAGCLRSANSAYSLMSLYSGNGSTDNFSDKEFNLRGDGNAYADGTFNNNGADYAEFFESANGQALTLGATVVLDGNKVREATDQDPASAIIGVVRPKEPSKASMVIGNTAWNKWANKYLTDDFDRYIMEDHDVVEWTDEDGKAHSYESHNIPADVTVPADAVRKTHDDKGNKFQHYKLNPAWDKDAEYVNRENRPEWNIIGLLGQVKILKGQPVGDRWIKMRDVSATVEEWMVR